MMPRTLRRGPRGTIPVLLLLLVLSPPAQPAPAPLSADDAYRFSLLTIKAHLGTALELLRQRADFGHHLREPVQEVYAEIATVLEAHDAPFDESIVEQLAAASRATEPRVALAAIDTATTALDGSLARSGRMSPESVLAITFALMSAAADSYARAVEAHEVVDVASYQAGYGFASVAESLVRRAGGAGTPAGFRRLRDAVSLMRAAWPAVRPPQIANDPATVRQWLTNVEAAIEAIGTAG